MPELPEVQTVVNDLNHKVVGRRIVGVWSDWPKGIKDPLDQWRARKHAHVKEFEKAIRGSKIINVERRGKNILIYLSGDKLLLIHQKMTGHMLVGKWSVKCQVSGVRCQVIPLEPKAAVEDPYNKYIHLIFYLDNGKMLALSDLRKFAKAILGRTKEVENLPELVNLGSDALSPNLTVAEFMSLIRGEKRKIKQVLMDQQVIAGIGNIYSDDILWKAKVHPFKSANKLKDQELKAIYKAMREILKKAVKLRGTSTSDFRDTAGEPGAYTDERLVYQREGDSCQRCGTQIKRIKLGGRSAHYCPKCQKLPLNRLLI